MANSGAKRVPRELLIFYGVLMVFGLGYFSRQEFTEGQAFLPVFFDFVLTVFVAPLFLIAFGWFVLFGWWQLLERLGFNRLEEWTDRHWPFNRFPFR